MTSISGPVPDTHATKVDVAGANCPWCLNDALDRVRDLDGVVSVNSSMAEECVYVVHPGVGIDVVLEALRDSLHGASSEPESAMLSLDPEPTNGECRHGQATGHVQVRRSEQKRGLMETLTDAMNRLRAAGYRSDFSATAEGKLRCGGCGIEEQPQQMVIHDTVRFEGESNPGDEAILVALACECGCLGQYIAAYGPDTPPEDVLVLQALSRR